MHNLFVPLLLAITVFGPFSGLWAADLNESEDVQISKYVRFMRNEMTRVTPVPYRIVSPPSTLCAAPDTDSLPQNPHDDYWIHVFVSPGGKNAMTSGFGVYPAETIILKQKFVDASGTNTVFYTGMRKRERGYNPKLGDWEFFTLDRSGEKVTARGKIDSCMECHAKYKTTDFVSRRYLGKETFGW